MKLFEPSPWKLQAMIDAAMAKCDASVEQAQLSKEAREDARRVRGWDAEVKAKYYRRVQHGDWF